MATAAPASLAPPEWEAARRHFILRFSVGTTFAFVLCEAMGWQPAALAPVLTGLLLANLPFSPPPKVAFALVTVMGISAWTAYGATLLLSEVPHLLFGLIGVVLFLAFAGLAQDKARLPLTLVLICITVTPLITLTVPQIAGIIPAALERAIALAVIVSWLMFAIWPRPSPKTPPPPAMQPDRVVLAAALGAAIVLPLMLIFLLFGITDAIPVLLTTVLIVSQMEQERASANASAKLTANFLGGFAAGAAYFALSIAPSLIALALISFLIGVGFALQIVKGGVRGGNALLGYNAAMIIFGLALLKGSENSGTWGARVVQFAIASVFAVGMMSLLWHRVRRPPETAS
mgnify:CR=1 FL=1